MTRHLFFLLVPLIALFTGGCRPYKVLPDSYILKGHDYFINIPSGIGVYLGPEFMDDSILLENNPPLKGKKLNFSQQKILREIGYDRKSYSVLFRSEPHSPVDFFAVANSEPQSKDENRVRFLNTNSLQQKTSEVGNWYFSTHRKGEKVFYHAVLPLSERLFAEKYVGFVFPLPADQADYSRAEKFIMDNLAELNSPKIQHVHSKTVVGKCAVDPEQEYYHGYIIPEGVINHEGYMLLAAYSLPIAGKRELIYYRVMDPGWGMGAFRICPGEYTLEYLSLEGEVRWSEQFSPIPQEKQ